MNAGRFLRHRRLIAGGLAALASGAVMVAAAAPAPVVIASKPFAESFLLAEMFAQVLEAHGFAVDRRPGLGATEIAFRALREGAVDVYPEYTGTGLVAILHEAPSHDARAVFRRVAAAFARRWQVRWLPPLGFENTYALAVRPETARRFHLRTLDDLAREAGHLTAGLSPDFVGREDGLAGLRRTYALAPQAVRSLGQAVKYQALAAGEVDFVDGYSTDGAIARHGFVVLEDDRGFFPAYEAAALVGSRLARERPAALDALTTLSGRIDAATMRQLNERVEVAHENVADVARDALAQLGVTASLPATGRTDAARGAADQATPMEALMAPLPRLTLRHLELVAVSLGFAVVVAVPLGLLLERVRRAAETLVRATGLLQTIPSIALLAFMIPLLGIGVLPAVVALFAYSLYPIVRNTYTGVRDADPAATAAGRALGMTPRQVLLQVRLPLAAPVIMAGIRTAAVINVGTATLAAFIGAGGLGDPIVAGLALNDTPMILSGAVPAALLALVVDLLLGGAERLVRARL